MELGHSTHRQGELTELARRHGVCETVPRGAPRNMRPDCTDTRPPLRPHPRPSARAVTHPITALPKGVTEVDGCQMGGERHNSSPDISTHICTRGTPRWSLWLLTSNRAGQRNTQSCHRDGHIPSATRLRPRPSGGP